MSTAAHVAGVTALTVSCYVAVLVGAPARATFITGAVVALVGKWRVQGWQLRVLKAAMVWAAGSLIVGYQTGDTALDAILWALAMLGCVVLAYVPAERLSRWGGL